MRPSGRNLEISTSPKWWVILAPVKPGVALLCRCLLDRIQCLGCSFSLNSPRVYPFFWGWLANQKLHTNMTTNPFCAKKISQSVQFFGWVPFFGGWDFFLAAHKQGYRVTTNPSYWGNCFTGNQPLWDMCRRLSSGNLKPGKLTWNWFSSHDFPFQFRDF